MIRPDESRGPAGERDGAAWALTPPTDWTLESNDPVEPPVHPPDGVNPLPVHRSDIPLLI